MKTPELKTTLLVNSGFSGLCGVICVVFATSVASWLGTVPALVSQILGVALIIFALDLVWVAKRLPNSWRLARLVFFADVAWVAMTPVVIGLFLPYLSTLGILLLIDAALIVGVFAWWEYLGLKSMKPAGALA